MTDDKRLTARTRAAVADLRRPADPPTGLIVSHQRWDMTQAVSGCGGGGSDATLDNAHVAEDYLARTTTSGFQLWWRQLMGSDATLDNAHVAEDYLARTTTMYRIIQ
jgi:hypothetical protein